MLPSLNTKGGAKSYPNLACQCFVDTHGRPASLRTETEDALMGGIDGRQGEVSEREEGVDTTVRMSNK